MYYLKVSLSSLIFASALLLAAAVADPTNNSLTSLKQNPIAPEFILQDITGKQHALSDYRGKVVVINFWASWCPPCVAEMPSLQAAADYLARFDIPLLGIGVGETPASVTRFLNSTPVSFPLLLDTKSEVSAAWAIPSLPTTIVIDQEGKMVFVALGAKDWDNNKILQQITSLLKTP